MSSATLFSDSAKPALTESSAVAPRLLRRCAMVLLLLAMVWAPIPLGSNRPWSLGVLACWVWLAVVMGLSSHVSTLLAGRWPRPVRKAALGLALAFGCSAWVLIQWQWGHDQGGFWVHLDSYATQQYLLRTLTYAGAMLAVLLAIDDRRQALWLLAAILVGGLLQALISVALYASGKPFVYWFDVIDPQSRPSGTFINPDHLAGYLELALSAGVGFMLALVRPRARSRTWSERIAAFSEFVMSPKMLVRLALVLLVIALVLTRSRAGNGTSLLGILLVGAVMAWRSVQWRRPALWLVGSMLIIDVIMIGQWVGLDTVVKRMKGTAEASSTALATFGLTGSAAKPSEESLQQRLTVPLSALPLIEERPWAGWGGGSFALAYPKVKPDTVFAGYWDHAHNDYVQVAADLGLVGLMMWVGIGVYSMRKLWPMLVDSADRVDRGVAVAALMGLFCLGLHSVVDFNLHIPATALTLSMLLALVWALPGLPQSRRRRSRTRNATHSNREDES